MPRRKTKQNEAKMWERAKWTGFVNVRLQSTEKKEITESLLSLDECLQFLQDAATDGYKVSLSYSIPEDVYTIALTGVYVGRPNAGLTMSIRHREFDKAVSALKWCHEFEGPNGDWSDRWGDDRVDDW